MLKGMKLMVEKKFIHRDLKPENIFVDSGIYKIGDFGFAEPNTKNEFFISCGTPGYMCP